MMSADEANIGMDAEKAVKEPLTGKDTDSPSKVKFVTSTTADGKNDEVNIVTGTQHKSVLSKEELMKFANDPFWIRLRLILFILFWVIWLAMLIGAIVIIIVVPKCPPSSRLKWYQKTSLYEVEVKSFVDGLLANFNYFNSLAMDSIVLHKFHGVSFTELNTNIGTEADFKNFVETAEKKGKRVILAFDLRYTSVEHEWFKKAMSADSEYADYYLTTDNMTIAKDRHWVVFNESNTYYFSPEINGRVDKSFATLNYENRKVVSEMKEVLKYWKMKKVNGFQLLNADNLMPDEVFSNNTFRNVEVVKRLRKHLYTKIDVSGKTGFFVQVTNRTEMKDFVGKPDTKIADLIVTDFFTTINKTSKAKDVKKAIDDHYNSLPKWETTAGGRYGPWLACRISSFGKPLEETVGVDMINTAFMLSYLLPNCTIALNAGDELMTENDDWSTNDTYYTNQNISKLILVRNLGKLRRQYIDTILMGSTHFPYEDEDVFTMVRFYPGLDGFLFIANFADIEKSIKLSGTSYLPDKGSVILASKDSEPKPPIGAITLNEEIKIGRKQSVLIQFKPSET